ncbi:MAG: YihY/virulence factor BrkB family protein [Alphaproteobacteria bacterium]|nr:YihY/virulence factor BrkB family protein [Alphaproteobacteria bacterium]
MFEKLRKIAYESAEGFFVNRLSTAAAAMAFYTMFALGPIMIFSIAIAEPFVGKPEAQAAIFEALGTIIEPEHLRGIQRFATQDLFRGRGLAAFIGVLVLLYTGSRVFVELDDAFDVIWRGKSVHQLHIVLATIKSRLIALLMMILLGVLLIAVILSSVVLSAYKGALETFPILGEWIGPAISSFTHYAILAGFFTFIYKWLPRGGVPWRFALISGAVNAILFLAGNHALVYYFEVTRLTSAFGATAGFAAIMVWMYWTSLTILIGAQIGRATRDAFDTKEPVPDREAVPGDIAGE